MDTLVPADITDMKVPVALREDVAQIAALTNGFCTEHLDDEYRALCRQLIGMLARKRPSPLATGDLQIWAAAAIYTVGSINFLFDPTQTPHLTGADIAHLTGQSKSTIANKSGVIRRALRLDAHDHCLYRPSTMDRHPNAWYVEIDGITVDARSLPVAVQAQARRRGLIPR